VIAALAGSWIRGFRGFGVSLVLGLQKRERGNGVVLGLKVSPEKDSM
jgi:hypothetical protein